MKRKKATTKTARAERAPKTESAPAEAGKKTAPVRSLAWRQGLAGKSFTANWKGATYELKVIEKDGDILYRYDGQNYKSPSAAAHVITNGAVNGWVFFKIGAEE